MSPYPSLPVYVYKKNVYANFLSEYDQKVLNNSSLDFSTENARNMYLCITEVISLRLTQNFVD